MIVCQLQHLKVICCNIRKGENNYNYFARLKQAFFEALASHRYVFLLQSLRKSGFYLGYLRGRSSPSPKCPTSPPKILLSLRYIGNYIAKIIQTRRGPCTHCNILKIVSQNAPDCISAHNHFKKFPRGLASGPS